MSAAALLTGLVLGSALGAGAVLAARRERRSGMPDLERAALGALVVRDRRIAWANARAAAILGAALEALPGAEVRTFHLDEGTYQRFRALTEDLQAGGPEFRGDVRMRRLDGTPFWAFLAASPLEAGRPGAGVLWLLEDATDRVETKAALEEVLSLNEKLIAASPTGVLLYRAADGRCVMANEAAARILRGRREDLLEQNFRRIGSWYDSGLREAADRALATGSEEVLDVRLTSSFGADVRVRAHLAPFHSRGEQMLLVLGDDVSERFQALTALRASEEKYRVVVETLNEGLALVDAGGLLTFCNGRLAEMGGYRIEEMLGRPYADFIRASELQAVRDRRLLAEGKEAETFEVGLMRRDGSYLDAQVSVASVLDADGAATALAILVTDVSIRKRIEREREHLVAELEQKNRELETLLYVASHDLRSPLVNIQGFSQRLAKSLDVLRREVDLAPTREAFKQTMAVHLEDRMPASLEFIRASGARMDAIINGLLTLSRAGRMVLRTEVLDMNAVLRACAGSLAFQLQSAGGRLEVGDLPPCQADPVQAAQIMSNLLDNAIKYRSPEAPLQVRVTGAAGPGGIDYCVEDNGRGIPPEHRERVWEIFQRLDPQGPVAGDGMGLTLVRRMAERNGGRVWLEAAPERGCRFHLELPAVPR